MNMNLSSALRIVSIVFLLACSAVAQTLTLDQAKLTHGKPVNVTFQDSSRAGQTVVIEIVSGGIVPKRDVLSITLDQDGEGSSSWVTPPWNTASFQGPGAPVVSVGCNP